MTAKDSVTLCILVLAFLVAIVLTTTTVFSLTILRLSLSDFDDVQLLLACHRVHFSREEPLEDGVREDQRGNGFLLRVYFLQYVPGQNGPALIVLESLTPESSCASSTGGFVARISLNRSDVFNHCTNVPLLWQQ